MPIYEYRCDECGELTEVMQRINDPLRTECQTCGGTLRKQISAPAFQFKGTGWYVTDYSRKGGGSEGAETSGKESGKESGGKGADASPDGGAGSGGKAKTSEGTGAGSGSTADSKSAKVASGSGD